MIFQSCIDLVFTTLLHKPPLIISPFPGVLTDEDVAEEDTAPVAVESEDIKKELERLNWPQVEGDTAPSAMIPKATTSLQKQIAKLEPLVIALKDAENPTALQKRNPAMIDYKIDFWYQTCADKFTMIEITGHQLSISKVSS